MNNVRSYNAVAVKKSARKLTLIGAASAAVIAFASMPAAAGEPVEIDIQAEDLGAALNAFGRQTATEIAFSPAVVEGKRLAEAIQGKYEPDEALDKILNGTGLEYRLSDANIIIVSDADVKTAEADERRGFFRVAQAGDPGSGAVATVADEDDETKEDEKDVVVVTGTRIKGVKDQFSPVTQIGRDDMDLAGYANVSDIFEDLPQNFGGGVSLDGSGAATGAGAGSSSINLRGLGNEATLILLNGRRLSAGGVDGNFVDISAIPASAIDRIELLTDGASAIYGSDAIAGVVNIILRDDFHGAESRLYLDKITDSAGGTLKAGQTVGFSGDRAHGLVSYEYSSEDELDANDKDFAADALEPTYLLPFSQKHSVFASGGVALSDRVSVTADAYYNRRKTRSFRSIITNALLQRSQEVEVEQYGAAAGINISLFSDWEADVSAAYSLSNHDSIFPTLNSGAVGLDDSQTEIFSVDASAGGSLFSISDEPVRAVFGGHFRSERADLFSLFSTGASTLPPYEVLNSRDVFSAFAELYAPLISESDGVPGAERLAVTVAGRLEDYSDVGSTLDPKVGVIWTPINGFTVRGTYGTSFRAPRLSQLRDLLDTQLNIYVDPVTSAESVALILFGLTSDLDPEQATTWTVGFDVAPAALEGFQARATYFNIDYSGRVGQPGLTLNSEFKYTNFTGVPILNPGQQDVQDLVDSSRSFLNISDIIPSLGPFMLSDVTTLLDNRFQNLSGSSVEGVDLEVTYETSSDLGDWSFFLNSTILTGYTEQTTPITPVIDLLNTYGNPVDLKLRGGVTLRTTPIAAAVYVNYVGDYIDDEATDPTFQIDSWTTLDASLRLDLGELFGGVAQDASLAVTLTNLFNEDPPTIGPQLAGSGPVYDPANADPAGRRVGLLLTKKW